MDERRFTLEEADALLPELRRLAERARDLAGRLREPGAGHALQSLRGGNGGGHKVNEVVDVAGGLRSVIEEISGHGVVFRDPATGLLDFPGEIGGRPVFLCWRLGEPRVDWWHDRDAGFAGRQRLDRG